MFTRLTSKYPSYRIFLAAAVVLFAAIAVPAGIALADAAVSISPTTSANTYNYGNVGLGVSVPQTFTITNSGTSDLVTGVLDKNGAAAFSALQNNSCNNKTIVPGATCSFQITVLGGSLGLRTATVDIPSNLGTTTLNLSVTIVRTTMSVSGNSHDFGAVEVTTSSAAYTVTVTNTGTDAGLKLGSVVLGGSESGDYMVDSDSCSNAVVAPNNGTCSFAVTFSPLAEGTRSATISFHHEALETGIVPRPYVISLTGTGTPATGGAPGIDVSPASKDFGSVNTGDTSSAETFTITNTGNEDLVIGSLALDGANPGDYDVLSDTCSNMTVAPAGTCTFQATFSPSVAGSSSAEVDIPSNVAGSPTSVALSGTGVEAPATTNLLINGSFDIDANANGKADGWKSKSFKMGADLDGYDCDPADRTDGACSVRMVGDRSKTKLSQDLKITGYAGDHIVLTFDAASLDADLLKGSYRVVVQIKGTPKVIYNLDRGTNGWGNHVIIINALKNFKKISIVIEYSGKTGFVWWDNFVLTQN
jgi:hypothetical protein